MTKSQKVWVKPELIILVRSKPEEAVLTVCKAGAAGPFSEDGKCDGRFNGFCVECFFAGST